jgi:hypothetical protein
MSFADIENRATASAMSRLANARGSFDGVTDFPVIFDNGTQAVLNGLADAAQPSVQIVDADLGAKGIGDAINIVYRGITTNYLLRNPLPDGAGMTSVALELAPV